MMRVDMAVGLRDSSLTRLGSAAHAPAVLQLTRAHSKVLYSVHPYLVLGARQGETRGWT